MEITLTDQEIVDPQETLDLGGHFSQNSQNSERIPQKASIPIEPQKLKNSEIRSVIFQASHDNYEVIQNEISNNIERLSQRVDEQIENGFRINLSFFEEKLTEALSSLRNTVESVVSAVSGLENRDNIEARDRVHTPIASITPER